MLLQRLLSRKFLPLLSIAFCVLLCMPQSTSAMVRSGSGYYPPQAFGTKPSANNPYGGGPMDGHYSAEHDYEFDYEVSADALADRGRLSTADFLERHGLPQIAEHLGDFIRQIDVATRLFDHLEIRIFNGIWAAFRDTFVQAVDDARRSMDASGPISLATMREFFRKQESLFNARLPSLDFYRKWAGLLSQTHVIFDALAQLYQLCIENGMPLYWWMLQMISPALGFVRDDLLDEETFSELLKLPGSLQSQLHDVLEGAFTSGYGPMFKIAIQTMTNLVARRHDEEL